MNDATLAALFSRYRTHGDGRALATVFDCTAKELLDLACHLVRDPLEAEDLVQATFVTAIQKGARYDGSTPLQGWLYGILWREAAKARRRAARRVEPERLAERRATDPTAAAAEAEFPEAVAAVLARLPGHYREVLDPLLFDERRPEHIAASLGRSPGTVRSQIHRGLEELRRALAPRFAAYGALALPTRGLGSIRAEVLRAAGVPAATAALPPAAVLAASAGAALAGKAALVASLATAAVLGGAWVMLRDAPRGGPGVEVAALERPPAHAAAAPVVERSEDDPARSTVSPAPVERMHAPRTARSHEEEVAYWLARFAERPDDWRHGWNVTEELAKLPAGEALAVMTEVWPHLTVPVKEQALKPFVFHGGRPNALPILHLAALDPALSVQQRAFEYLKDYAFRDFALDYEGYLAWAAVNVDRPVGEVLVESGRRLVEELLAASPRERSERMQGLRDLDLRAGEPAGVDLAAELRAAGGLRLLEVALADPSPEMQDLALRWSKSLAADEGWLRAWVLPVIETPPEPGKESLLFAAFDALDRPGCGFAREPILGYLERSTRTKLVATQAAARTLGASGDVSLVPPLIELVLRDTTGELAYDVGYFALAKLTGVTWQEGYDGEWWADWWQKNRRRFPAEVAGVEVR